MSMDCNLILFFVFAAILGGHMQYLEALYYKDLKLTSSIHFFIVLFLLKRSILIVIPVWALDFYQLFLGQLLLHILFHYLYPII
jgi:hypothetical protein